MDGYRPRARLGGARRRCQARAAAVRRRPRCSRAMASTRRCRRSPPPPAPASRASTASSRPSTNCSRRSSRRRLEQIADAADARRCPRGRPLVGTDRDAADDRRAPVRPTTSSARRGSQSPTTPTSCAADRATPRRSSNCWRSRAEGRLRSDATTLDLRLLFAATRAAKQVEPEAWRRMLELLIDALDAGPGVRG